MSLERTIRLRLDDGRFEASTIDAVVIEEACERHSAFSRYMLSTPTFLLSRGFKLRAKTVQDAQRIASKRFSKGFTFYKPWIVTRRKRGKPIEWELDSETK